MGNLRPKFESRVKFVETYVQIMGLTGFTHEEHWNSQTVVLNTEEDEFRMIYDNLKNDFDCGLKFELSDEVMFDKESERHFFKMFLIDGHRDIENERDYHWDKATMRVALETI